MKDFILYLNYLTKTPLLSFILFGGLAVAILLLNLYIGG